MIERLCKVETKLHLVRAIIIGAAVVIFWRGIWNLMDIYLFPGNPSLSSFSSILLGLLIIMFENNLTKKLL